jgi:hypothetical protein
MKPSALSYRQLFEFELEQIKTIELFDKEEIRTQSVINESASRGTRNAELNA